jgi:uncharacterized protein
MTPQEQQLVADLFDRLASLEGQRRDPDAERLIREGLGRAPNSVYALVQSVLVQDEALKRANGRIEELERAIAAPAESGGGFLDSMRNAIMGRDQPRASVPSVRAGGMGSSGAWGSGPGASQPQGAPQAAPQGYPQGYPQQQGGYPMGAGPMGGGGSSFLGTAAATVAGVVGGAMLLDGIRSMMGSHHSFAGDSDHAGGVARAAASPWDSGGDHGSGNLARDAGVGDIGGGGNRAAASDDSSRSGFLSDDAGDAPDDQGDDDFDAGDDAGDMGGGDYDTA